MLAPHLSEESSRGHDGDRRHAAKHGSQRSQQAQGGRCSRESNLLKKYLLNFGARVVPWYDTVTCTTAKRNVFLLVLTVLYRR